MFFCAKTVDDMLKLGTERSWYDVMSADEEPRKDDEIIVYCRSGRRSEVAGQHLQQLGYKRVFNYKGSALEWFADRQ
jgi:rhodanese-related sulfurtransferase